MAARERIGSLFPAGGPVRPEFVIGRDVEVGQIASELGEGVHVILLGPRRIGKTTVCNKVCDVLRATHLVLQIEVPERSNADDLLQLIVDRCQDDSIKDEIRAALRASRPFIKDLIKRGTGVELDVQGLGAESEPSDRAVLELPRALAKEARKPVLLFLDELQRVVDYVDGEQLLHDLVDLYAGATDVVLLVDGSDERAIEGMLGAPVHFAKLSKPRKLDPVIPRSIWAAGLRERFAQAELAIDEEALELLLDFGAERPYPTMTGAQAAALAVRQLGSDQVSHLDAQMGIDEARRKLEDDGV